MKHQLLATAAIIVILLATNAPVVLGQSKEKEKTVKGEVVDLWCYLDDGSHGASHKECATTCAKAGNPIGILDAKGNIYVAMGSNDHQPGRELLIDRMSETVTVTGKLAKKGGTQVLYIKSVK
ncbi:MAG: hypothetical protein HYR76_07415 [Ignavibacteria bacterium]|nr:hypothetical protein [Ignavibacteria bacterium]MBI3766180.1 hypothetical protein [Ignavibacteriales bacterium]